MSGRTLAARHCARLIREARSAVALTGAGISTAAGLPDFRGPDGIYQSNKYGGPGIFEIGHFRRDPRGFFRFARDVLDATGELRPTYAHEFLARLEEAGLLAAVITQNIDPLHQKAGSKNVVPLHGTYHTLHCLACGREYSYDQMVELLRQVEVPRCDCDGREVIKPDIVFFGEIVRELDAATALARSCDLMLVLGSSLVVYPAAMLPETTAGTVVVVNKGEVGLAPGPERYFVSADLDEYTREVAGHLFAGSLKGKR